MKRGKDDEKTLGPMFPRLHVNDTDKGGPRAPPRNKMALYEQFSIPSQRYNRGLLPLNPSNSSSLITPGSSNQGSVVERNSWSCRSTPPTHFQMGEKLHAQQSEGEELSNTLIRHIQRKIGDDDDFRVPVFSKAAVALSHCRSRGSADRESQASANASNTTCDRVISEQSAIRNEEREDHTSPNCDSLDEFGTSLRNESRIETQQANGRINGEVERSSENNNGVEPRYENGFREDRDSPDGVVNDDEHCRITACRSPRPRNGDLSDGVSETSMVDSISSLDISPDDVVRVIGQKRFWKARKAIANQQRVFAVQVFELHRLIKVQRLIAGSPHVMLEDGAYVGNPSPKSSPAKKLLPPEYAVKSLPQVTNKTDDTDKASQKLEGSAENAVGRKSSLSSTNQTLNSMVFPANPTLGSSMGATPWSFPQSQGPQWLVPVMSPSEGLIYKPYPGPGFMGPVCGGYGPFGPTPPMPGSFMTPAYGVPAPPMTHGYFPPYGLPVMSPNNTFMVPGLEQTNHVAGSGSVGQTNMQEQSSCNNLPAQKDRPQTQPAKHKPSKESRVQGSTGSSPNGDRIVEQPNHVFRQFSSDGSAEAGAPLPAGGKPTRVIKVMPCNPNLAPESAARIFQSIQAERKQYDLA